MFEDLAKPGAKKEADLIGELARNTPEHIRAMRKHARFEASIRLEVLDASLAAAGASGDAAVTGVTVDISGGGCLVTLERPVMVGDVVRLRFDAESVAIPTVYARCLRSRLLREDSIETAFVFFSPIDLDEAFGGSGPSDLLL